MEDEEREAEKKTFVESQMQDPQFLAQVQAMEPTEREAYIDQLFRDYTGETAIADDKLAMAVDRLNTGTPEGRQAGNVYVAANPLEHLGAVGNRYQGGKERDAAMDSKQALSDSRSAGLQQTGNLMLGADAVKNAANQATIDSLNKGARTRQLYGRGEYE